MHRATSHPAGTCNPGNMPRNPRPTGGTLYRLAARGLRSLFMCLLLACAALPVQANGTDETVEHVVVVWLKSPGNAEHRRRIITASEVLREIPGVTGLRTGEVIQSDRSIVDSSFDVALIVSFADQAAMQTYLTHPVHVELVEHTLKPLVDKILVYDFR